MLPNSTVRVWIAVYNLYLNSDRAFCFQVSNLLDIPQSNTGDFLYFDAVIIDILPRVLTNKQLYNLGDPIVE